MRQESPHYRLLKGDSMKKQTDILETMDYLFARNRVLSNRIHKLAIRVHNLEDAGQEDLSPEQKNAQAIAVLRALIRGYDFFSDFNGQIINPSTAIDTLEKAIEAREK